MMVSGAIISLIILLVFAISLIDWSKVRIGPQKISFDELCQNKEKYFAWKSFSFENGTIIYFNETQRIKFAIVVPIPIPEELNESTYIAAIVPTRLKVGDKVNIEGAIKKAEHEGKTMYYLDGYKVTKTGTMDTNDPDFQHLLQIIEEKKRQEDFFIWWWIMWWLFWSPTSPLNPLNPDYPYPFFSFF